MFSLELSPAHAERATIGIAVTLAAACLLTVFIILQRPAPFSVRCSPHDGSMDSAFCQSQKLTLDGEPWPDWDEWMEMRTGMLCLHPSLQTERSFKFVSDAAMLKMAQETARAMKRETKPSTCQESNQSNQAFKEWMVLERIRQTIESDRFRPIVKRSTRGFWIPAVFAIGAIGVVALLCVLFFLRRLRPVQIRVDGMRLIFQGHGVDLSRIRDIDLEGERIVLSMTDGTRRKSPLIQLGDIQQAQKFCDEVLDAVSSQPTPPVRSRPRQAE